LFFPGFDFSVIGRLRGQNHPLDGEAATVWAFTKVKLMIDAERRRPLRGSLRLSPAPSQYMLQSELPPGFSFQIDRN
jgi:hypothetical protein